MATEADLIQKFKDLNIPVGADFEELIHEAFIGANLVDQVNSKADDSKVVHTADMRKPASDVAGIEEVSTLQTQVDNSAVGTNLLINSNFLSGLAHWSVNGGNNSDCKAVVTTDSDGNTCIHITGTGKVCGLYCYPVSFNQNQVTTGSVLVKGIGELSRVGFNGVSASNFGTISTESYSKVGSTTQVASSTSAFCIYFNPVNGVVDVYIKFAKLELGSHATDWCPNPAEILTKADDSKVVHLSGAEEISGQKTFDVAPIDKATGNPYITKSDVTTAISAATANMADDSKVAHLSGTNNFTGSIQHNGNPVGAYIKASNNDEDSAINDSTNGNSDDIYYWFED